MNVEIVARDHCLDIDKFCEFAMTHSGAFIDRFSGQLCTTTWHVDELIADFLAAGNERLAWVENPNGGLIQPGWLL